MSDYEPHGREDKARSDEDLRRAIEDRERRGKPVNLLIEELRRRGQSGFGGADLDHVSAESQRRILSYAGSSMFESEENVDHTIHMEARVSRLEATVEHIDKDLAEIKADQKSIFGVLTDIRVEIAKRPTTSGLWGMVATVLGVALAMIGTFIGILAYLGSLPRLPALPP